MTWYRVVEVRGDALYCWGKQDWGGGERIKELSGFILTVPLLFLPTSAPALFYRTATNGIHTFRPPPVPSRDNSTTNGS